MNKLIEQALESNAWPFQEAKKILERINHNLPKKGYVLFETGYGPSGLPHIGTFGEVVRTTMVRKAFEYISDMPTKLFCISDDMDGMRKVPDNIPNKEKYKQYLDLPLTSIPDPFQETKSYGDYMNGKLKSFLDHFDFEYEFKSATKCYQDGLFNQYLIQALKYYDEIMDIMLPTLGPERRATYSPFMPICQKTGKVLQVPIVEHDVDSRTITYKDTDGKLIKTKVTDGKCKLQWKPDFGMRWAAFDVDFEMYGKEHLVNGPIYTKICKVLKNKAPHQMFYELFLDENGEKISKSKGNGIAIEKWLKYAPKESLSLFMYQSPRKAKKLCFDVIPKNVDEYIKYLDNYHKETDSIKKFSNPIYHIHNGHPPKSESSSVTYSLLLNLISACNTDNLDVIWGYIRNFDKNVSEENSHFLNSMIQCAINYYHDFVKPHKKYRSPSEKEKQALLKLANFLSELKEKDIDVIQNQVYAIGKEYDFELRNWFKAIYEILLGSSQGPRVGTFIAFYGISETIDLIKSSMEK